MIYHACQKGFHDDCPGNQPRGENCDCNCHKTKRMELDKIVRAPSRLFPQQKAVTKTEKDATAP